MRYLQALLCAALAAPAVAQEGEPADPSLAAWKALQTEYQAAVNEYFKPAREAQAKGEKVQLDPQSHPNKSFVPRFKEFAAQHKGTEGALQALVFVLRTGVPEEQEAALKTLLADHMESKALKDVAGTLRYRPDGATHLRTLVEKSPHAEVRGVALLTLGQALKATSVEEALAALEKVKNQYADLPWYRGTLGEVADGEIFELKNLSVGLPAPEIEGADVDGGAFKLSDYRGKVVLLDFWGDW